MDGWGVNLRDVVLLVACEVSAAAEVLIQHQDYARLAFSLPSKRRGNKYSLLSAILTRREDVCLSNICTELGTVQGAKICCLLYDGCVVRCADYSVRSEVRRVLTDARGRIGIPTVIKPWWSPMFDALPIAASLVLSGDAVFGSSSVELIPQRGVTAACLFNAVSYLVGDTLAPEAPSDGPFCVSDFNAIAASGSQRRTRILQLTQVEFSDVKAGDFVAYSNVGTGGHFFGVRAEPGGGFVVLDEVCRRPVLVVGELFVEKFSLLEGALMFCLSWGEECVIPTNASYARFGGAIEPVLDGDVVRTPLERCISCDGRLARHSISEVQVLTFSGPVGVRDTKLRCVRKKCRLLYSNNYVSFRGGHKLNTAPTVGELGKIMMTTGSTGVSVDFLSQHYARTFRSASNPTSECASMWRWLEDVGKTAQVNERRMRDSLRAAMFYYMRLLDVESGVEDGLLGRIADYMFEVDSTLRDSPLYDGYDMNGFVIYDALRDSPPVMADVKCLISDGNQVSARDLDAVEVELRKATRLRGRPKGSVGMV